MSKRTKTGKLDFIPGIKEMQFMDPRELKANVRNWRTHSQRQRQAFQATLKANGWAGAALLNRRTGNLIDGHMRTSEAIKAGTAQIPVLIGDWTEEQEKQLLATLDPLGSMAGTNSSALASLTEEIAKQSTKLEGLTANHAKALKELNRDLSTYAANVETGTAPSILLERAAGKAKTAAERTTPEVDDGGEDQDGSIRESKLRDDVVFNSDHVWGLPALRDDMLSTVVPTSTWNRSPESVSGTAWYCYSAGPNTLPPPDLRGGGVLGFFTEDFRFEMAWNDTPTFTKRLCEQDWGGVCLPDYSTWSNWPFPVRLHNLYRSRWCGRYWQEAGVPVIPILQSIGDSPLTTDEDDLSYQFIVLDSLPQEIPVAAIQVRTSEKKATDYWAGVGAMITEAITTLRIENLVIYGGTEYAKYLSGHLPKTRKTKFHLIDSFIAKRRKTK